MIDIKLIRDNMPLVKAQLARRGCDANVEEIAELDAQWRELTAKTETMRADRNRLSKECKSNPEAREQVKALKVELQELEDKLNEITAAIQERLSWLPNLLADDVPDGKDDNDNLELR